MVFSKLPLIMVKCLVLTIIIELIIALILGVRDKKDIINIILVNVLTNPIVVTVPYGVLFSVNYTAYRVSLYVLEILTVITEGFIYFKVLKYKKINPFLLSLILNLGSYLLGLVIDSL